MVEVMSYVKQECIPVGCVTSAAVAVSPAMHCSIATHAPAMHTPRHTCPLPCTPLYHTHPPAMHAPPSAVHAPLPCMPPAMHAPVMHIPCHTFPLPRTSPHMDDIICSANLSHLLNLAENGKTSRFGHVPKS